MVKVKFMKRLSHSAQREIARLIASALAVRDTFLWLVPFGHRLRLMCGMLIQAPLGELLVSSNSRGEFENLDGGPPPSFAVPA